MAIPFGYSSVTPTVPPRVQAGLFFLKMMQDKVLASQTFEGSQSSSIELTAMENEVSKSALQMLKLYFSGENDYGDTPAVHKEDTEEDGPSHFVDAIK